MYGPGSKRRKISSTGSDGEHAISFDEGNPPVEEISNETSIAPGSKRIRDEHVTNNASPDHFQYHALELLAKLRPLLRRRLEIARPLLHQIKSIIEKIPDGEALSPSEGKERLYKKSRISIYYPQTESLDDARFKVRYERPRRINVVGSFGIGTALVRKQKLPLIDLAVTMPNSLFDKKDYLDHRYFYKRAFYLACIAEALAQNKELEATMQYDLFNDSILQPIILATPKGAMKQKFTVRIIPTVDAALFPYKRTLPSSSCLRKLDQSASTGTETKERNLSSIYNSTLRADCCVESYLKVLHSTGEVVCGFRDGCILLSVWLSQRDMGSRFSKGGFGCFESATILALLLNGGGHNGKPMLSREYSGIQLFKAVLHFLATRDLIKDPALLGAKTDASAIDGFDGPVVWDGDRVINVLYKMTKGSYFVLRHHASLSLRALQQANTDSFQCLFAQSVRESFWSFDDTFSVVTQKSKAGNYSYMEGTPQCTSEANKLHQNLSRALGPRALLVDVRSIPTKHSSGFAELSTRNSTSVTLRVGLILNPDLYKHTVDRGPSVDDREASKSFRQFWSEKAELRRFQDGSILESVTWQDSNVSVHRQIIQYICQTYNNCQPDFESPEPQDLQQSLVYASDARQRFLRALKRVEEITAIVKNDSKIPLYVQLIEPSCWLPQNDSTKSLSEDVLECVVKLDSSASWPEDLLAVQRTKTALLIQLGDAIESFDSSYRCRIGQEASYAQISNQSFLEISASRESPKLRVRVFYEREEQLLGMKLRKAQSGKERQAVSDAILSFHKSFVYGPRHVQSLQRLTLRMPLLLQSIMLFRRWCAKHLLNPHIGYEVIDLLMIHIFTAPFPYSTPASVHSALLRTIEFISHWNWQSNALAVDLGGDLNAAHVEEAVAHLREWRKIDPNMQRVTALVASDCDTNGTVSAKGRLSKSVVSRLVALAKVATHQASSDGFYEDIESIFATGLLDFDFVLHFHDNHDPRSNFSNGSLSFKNLVIAGSNEAAADSRASPSYKLISELESTFSSSAIFFHDNGESPLVAGVWDGNLKSKAWKLGANTSLQPRVGVLDAANPVKVNTSAILNDILRLGCDLIRKVDLKG